MIKILTKLQLKGEIQVPASKSDCQRALICAAISKGKSIIECFGSSEDEHAMLEAIQLLGAEIKSINKSTIQISGIEHFPNEVRVSANESGLGFRLLAGVCASFTSKVELNAKGSLLVRTMGIYENILPKMGVEIDSLNGFPPLKIIGPLKTGVYDVDGSVSSQFISGLLIGFANLDGTSELIVKNLVSRPYIDMTISTLKSFNSEIEEFETDCFRLKGKSLTSCNYKVEADWSSASYWLVAAALGENLTVKNLNLNSLQADKALLSVLDNANCALIYSETGIQIDGSQRKAFEFDATNCPDLFPALVVLAAGIVGLSKITGIQRLVHKESNRALTLQSEFGKLGLKIELVENVMLIHGSGKLSGGKVASHNDHRIAMSLGIAALLTSSIIEISEAGAVGKSYPSFWEELESLSF